MQYSSISSQAKNGRGSGFQFDKGEEIQVEGDEPRSLWLRPRKEGGWVFCASLLLILLFREWELVVSAS